MALDEKKVPGSAALACILTAAATCIITVGKVLARAREQSDALFLNITTAALSMTSNCNSLVENFCLQSVVPSALANEANIQCAPLIHREDCSADFRPASLLYAIPPVTLATSYVAATFIAGALAPLLFFIAYYRNPAENKHVALLCAGLFTLLGAMILPTIASAARWHSPYAEVSACTNACNWLYQLSDDPCVLTANNCDTYSRTPAVLEVSPPFSGPCCETWSEGALDMFALGMALASFIVAPVLQKTGSLLRRTRLVRCCLSLFGRASRSSQASAKAFAGITDGPSARSTEYTPLLAETSNTTGLPGVPEEDTLATQQF